MMQKQEEASVMCFLIEASQALCPEWWKRLVYLKRHPADLMRDSCFFLRSHSLETMLSASRLFCCTVFGVLAAPVRGHNNRQTVSWAHPLQCCWGTQRAAGGRCRAHTEWSQVDRYRFALWWKVIDCIHWSTVVYVGIFLRYLYFIWIF